MQFYRGTIAQFAGTWDSGLASLQFRDGSAVHCDNGPLARALDCAFDGAIGEGHRIDNSRIEGEEIVYWLDEMGLCLGGFMPAYNWAGPDFPEGRGWGEGLDVDLEDLAL